MPDKIILKAENTPLEIDLTRTAVIVIDMQNTFIAKGGMFDIKGEDTELHRKIIHPTNAIIQAARNKGCKIIFTRQIFSPDLRETGGPESVHWNRVYPSYKNRPEFKGKMAVVGTWGYEFIEEIRPQPEDLVIDKPKYSAFFGTNLDINLRTYNIKYLIFTGIATNVCVESTIRDAYYHQYWPVMVSDACANSGPIMTQEATIWNVKNLFGWVTSSQNMLEALK